MKIVDIDLFDKEYLKPSVLVKTGISLDSFFNKHRFISNVIYALTAFIVIVAILSYLIRMDSWILILALLTSLFVALTLPKNKLVITEQNGYQIFFEDLDNLFVSFRRQVTLRKLNQDIILGVKTSDKNFFAAQYFERLKFKPDNCSYLVLEAKVFYHHNELGWTRQSSIELDSDYEMLINHQDKSWKEKILQEKTTFFRTTETDLETANQTVIEKKYRINPERTADGFIKNKFIALQF